MQFDRQAYEKQKVAHLMLALKFQYQNEKLRAQLVQHKALYVPNVLQAGGVPGAPGKQQQQQQQTMIGVGTSSNSSDQTQLVRGAQHSKNFLGNNSNRMGGAT